jgi:hypothetical protein
VSEEDNANRPGIWRIGEVTFEKWCKPIPGKRFLKQGEFATGGIQRGELAPDVQGQRC